MKMNEFDYHLPRSLIAQRPLQKRDHSKLLVLHQASGKIEHRQFRELTDYLRAGDVLVLNNTKVLPVRLLGRKKTSGLVEFLLVKEVKVGIWEVLFNTRGKIKDQEQISFKKNILFGTLVRQNQQWRLKFNRSDVLPVLEEIGKAPLPPYIKRPKSDDTLIGLDKKRYQTVYAAYPGSIAAPTAGLHFTHELLEQLRRQGVNIVYITLHVGPGTFRPVVSKSVEAHRMEAEFFEVKGDAVQKLINAWRGKKRIIAVGTTVCRTLETIADYVISAHPTLDTKFIPRSHLLRGWADLFIHPPYQFKLVKGLLTNFHLPRGTPLILVSTLAGKERIFAAYQAAIKKKYRFYSYGDAMLVI